MSRSMLPQGPTPSMCPGRKTWRAGTVDFHVVTSAPISTLAPVRTARGALRDVAAMLHLRPLLVTSDFDGTLSVPQLDPWGATVLPTAQRALRTLTAIEGVHVALLSGRTASDLSTRVRVGAADYLGNQGLERGRLRRRQRAESMVIVPHPAPEHAWIVSRLLEREVPRQVPEPWLVVEAKGPAVTFHYRAAPDVVAAGVRVAGSVDRLDPHGELVRFPGRRSLELRPPGAPGKGEAFQGLLDDVRPAVAFMIGDDRTDVAAFRVLRSARDAGQIHGRAIAVGPDPTMFDATGHEADVVLRAPRDVASFLAALARALSRPANGVRHSS
jgi:trehalose 6-phosphate phosphatase